MKEPMQSEARQTLARLQAQIGELEDQAFYDQRTGFLRYFAFVDRLSVRLGRVRGTDEWVACLLMDVDKLADINDRYGHPAGNQLIRTLADRIRRITPKEAVRGTLSGGSDEFLVATRVQRMATVNFLVSRLKRTLHTPYSLNGTTVDITVSGGAVVSDGSEDAEELIARADEHMYEAKRSDDRHWSMDLNVSHD